MSRILVTGATGFIGRRLVPALVDEGHDVRAMTRRPEAYDGPGEPVAGNVDDRDSLLGPLEGVDVAYYLVHSLDDADFERKDAEAARAFASAAAEQGVQQIIYMGGLGDDGDLSAHLRSRREVEGLLGGDRRPGDRAAGGHRRRRRRDLLGDHPPAGEEPPGDGGPASGRPPRPSRSPSTTWSATSSASAARRPPWARSSRSAVPTS